MPADLPPQFSARLDADVYALLAHSVLTGDRQLVREPDAGDPPIHFRAALDREAGTVRLLAFPPVTDEVGTTLGTVSATVSISGDPEGAFDSATGHVRIEVELTVDPQHLLARTSRVRLALSSDGMIREAELQAEGVPLTLREGTVTLVGHGTFEGGTLDGGDLWLAIACAIDDVVEA